MNWIIRPELCRLVYTDQRSGKREKWASLGASISIEGNTAVENHACWENTGGIHHRRISGAGELCYLKPATPCLFARQIWSSSHSARVGKPIDSKGVIVKETSAAESQEAELLTW